MGKNFIAMPLLLKLFTASILVVLAFVVGSAVPHNAISVFGRSMTSSGWWSSGAGLVTVITGSLMTVSAVLMLKRSRYGRWLYILSWIALSVSIPLVAHVTGTDVAAVPTLISNLVMTALIGLYLYRSQAVRNYFHVAADGR